MRNLKHCSEEGACGRCQTCKANMRRALAKREPDYLGIDMDAVGRPPAWLGSGPYCVYAHGPPVSKTESHAPERQTFTDTAAGWAAWQERVRPRLTPWPYQPRREGETL